MKKLLTPFMLLAILFASSVYADSLCLPRTDKEYKQMIIGNWGNSPTQKADDTLPVIKFFPSGKLTMHSKSCYEENILGRWSINDGKITINITQSVAPTEDSSGTIVCMGPNSMKLKWAVDDIQTVYRLSTR